MKRVKRLLVIFVVSLVVFILYLLIGGMAPFIKHPQISDDTKQQVAKTQFFSDKVGPDRAMIIEDNEDAMKLRLKAIADAEEKIVLSTFDFRSDNAGKDILSALLCAANRGVNVEIFADGFNSMIQMEGNEYFYALSSHPNIKIIIYNKVNLLTPWKGLGRMHDKYLIVDNSIYILGGRNTFGYFLGDYQGHKNYDRDVLVYNTGSENSSIYQVKNYYKKISTMDCCRLFHDSESLGEKEKVRKAGVELEKRYGRLLEKYQGFLDKSYDYQSNTLATNIINLLSNPTGLYAKEPVVFYGLMELAKDAQTEVKIHTPYIISDDEMNEGLEAIGDKTTIMTNSAENNGNLFGAIDYLNHKSDIIHTGVTIKEYEGGISYHGKSMTIDDDIAIVGSFNMDMRSAYIDTELMLVIHSEAVNQQLKESMEMYEKSAATVENETEYSYVPEGMILKPLSEQKKNIQKWFGTVMDKFRFLF